MTKDDWRRAGDFEKAARPGDQVEEEIAFDGVISQDERKDFENVLVFLRKLEESITDIMLIGLGKGKAAPGATGSGQARK